MEKTKGDFFPNGIFFMIESLEDSSNLVSGA